MQMTKKSLGQHWLYDKKVLAAIADEAQIKPGEVVLEIGPGTGTLTAELLSRDAKVIAVEKDEALAAKLVTNFGDRLKKLHVGDILEFDLSELPSNYKVVANIPYYLTSNLVRLLSETSNPPNLMVLLVQKEVAERICAGTGQMSVLGVSAQLYHECSLGQVVPADLFTPPPKVDSQVVILKRRPKPLFDNLDEKQFFRIVKAGFSQRRKKLRSSLSGGLSLTKDQADQILNSVGIDKNVRAQELSLSDWHKLQIAYNT